MRAPERVVVALAVLSCVALAWRFVVLGSTSAAGGGGGGGRAEEAAAESSAVLEALRTELDSLKLAMETSSVPKHKFDKLKDKALQVSGDLLRVRSEVEQYKEAAKAALAQGRVRSQKDTAAASQLNATFRVKLQTAYSQLSQFKEHNQQLELANERLEQQLAKASQDLRAQLSSSASNAQEKEEKENLQRANQDQELLDLRKQVERLRSERDAALALRDDATAAAGSLEEHDQSENGIDAGVGSVIELESDESMRCEDSLREMTSVVKALKARVQNLESERELLRKTAKEARAEAESAAKDLGATREQVESLSSEMKQKTKALIDAKAQVEQLQKNASPAQSSSQPSAGSSQSDFAGLGFGANGGLNQQQQQQPRQQQQQQQGGWQRQQGWPQQQQQQQQPQQQQGWQLQQQQPQQQIGGYAMNQAPLMGGGYMNNNPGGYPQMMGQGPGGLNLGGPQMQNMGNPCAQAHKFEFDSDRPGPAFHSQAVRSARECRQVCEGEYRCRSWVYTKSDAMCFLKESQSPSQPSTCCVSGLRCM